MEWTFLCGFYSEMGTATPKIPSGFKKNLKGTGPFLSMPCLYASPWEKWRVSFCNEIHHLHKLGFWRMLSENNHYKLNTATFKIPSRFKKTSKELDTFLSKPCLYASPWEKRMVSFCNESFTLTSCGSGWRYPKINTVNWTLLLPKYLRGSKKTSKELDTFLLKPCLYASPWEKRRVSFCNEILHLYKLRFRITLSENKHCKLDTATSKIPSRFKKNLKGTGHLPIKAMFVCVTLRETKGLIL